MLRHLQIGWIDVGLVAVRPGDCAPKLVGHDDLEVYERAQEGLRSNGNEWVNVQRLYDPSEISTPVAVANGTTEWQMRNQFRAWSNFMTMSM